jgi:hypothetical protein
MNLQESIRRTLSEDVKIPIYILRRLDFSSVPDQMKEGALRNFNKNISLDMIIDSVSEYVASEIIPWWFEENEIPEEDLNNWSKSLKKYIFHKYGEETKEYVKRVLPNGVFNDDGYKYVFVKHSEQNGGSGFSGSFDTWGDLILGYGWWAQLDWNEIKSDLDKMDEGKKIILKPNDKHNNYGYYFSIIKKKSNLQESIKKTLREELESKWNTGNKHGNKYNYQHGFCHYFAYNIIGKLKKLYPDRNIRYYLILADEVYDFDEGEVEQSYLVHAYIKIDDLYLDSNGFATEDEIKQRTQDWYDRQLNQLPEDYRIDIWHDEYNKIPKYYFNNQFCNVGTIKKDVEKFLSHPEVKELLQIIDNNQQIKEGLPNRTKELILDKVKTMGFDAATSIVGGKDNLSKITGINTYEEYLNLFNDLTISPSKGKPKTTLYKNDKGINVFVHYYDADSNMRYVFINNNILQKPFSMEVIDHKPYHTKNSLTYEQKGRVLRKWLKDTYDIEVKNMDFLHSYYPGEENTGGYLEYLK